MEEKKFKNIIITTFLIIVIILLIYGLLVGFVSGVKSKNTYEINAIISGLKNQVNGDLVYINRFDFDESGYVFKSDDAYYFITIDGEYLDMLLVKDFDISKFDASKGNIYLAYYNDPVVAIENDQFVEVNTLKGDVIFTYYK